MASTTAYDEYGEFVNSDPARNVFPVHSGAINDYCINSAPIQISVYHLRCILHSPVTCASNFLPDIQSLPKP